MQPQLLDRSMSVGSCFLSCFPPVSVLCVCLLSLTFLLSSPVSVSLSSSFSVCLCPLLCVSEPVLACLCLCVWVSVSVMFSHLLPVPVSPTPCLSLYPLPSSQDHPGVSDAPPSDTDLLLDSFLSVLLPHPKVSHGGQIESPKGFPRISTGENHT